MKHKHNISAQCIYYLHIYTHKTYAIHTCMSAQCDHGQTQFKDFTGFVVCQTFVFSGRLLTKASRSCL